MQFQLQMDYKIFYGQYMLWARNDIFIMKKKTLNANYESIYVN